LEGPYTDIMALVDQICRKANDLSPETVINIRMHSKRDEDVYATDKTEKF
ncbi:MAG: hypothetical protein ACJAVN_002735, partial [Roseivirga sp.]